MSTRRAEAGTREHEPAAVRTVVWAGRPAGLPSHAAPVAHATVLAVGQKADLS